MPNNFNKANRNKSTILLADLPASSSPLAQSRQIYTYHSKIGDHMRDDARLSAKTETRVYDNKVFGSCKKYQVSIIGDGYQRKDEEKDDYRQFYQTKKTFAKPYSQMTKYSDLVSKNRALVRRGIFNVPLKDPGVYIPKRNLASSRFPKYTKTKKKMSCNLTTSQQPFISSKKSTDMAGTFDRTLNFHMENYQFLLSKDRSNKSEFVGLKNNMNRILAAEMIDFKMRKKSMKNTTTIQY